MISQSAAVRAAGGKRRLASALLVSGLLHLLVLWPAALPDVAQGVPQQPLAATLRNAAAPAPPASPASPAAAPAKPARVSAAAPSERSQKIDTDSAAAFAVAAAPAVPPGLTLQEPGPAPAVAAVAGRGDPSAAGANPPAAAASGPATEGLNADGLRAYRMGLARGARAHKRYPALARERGWTGTAEVRVDVSREGRLRQVLLAHSSGHEALDRAALDMLARAASAAAVPDSLRGREFAVSLPVTFDLADDY